ncbi:Thioesterase/thiol ester dehydrase-isomerase [Thozetella sp. PMI_491]|nr:Thioesterase/thiol ester dehydrase-isomerase [Thozetella sp. PMI_491]
MAATLAEQVAVEEIQPGTYKSKALPDRMGNSMPIAYGGCVLGAATQAAYKTVPASFAIYSLVGQFLGPTSTSEKMLCVVHATRDTKSFATRRVEVKQLQPDGQTRTCLELLADFHVEEPSLLTYSTPPTRQYAGAEEQTGPIIPTSTTDKQRRDIESALQMFSMNDRFFETRPCREGVSGQNLNGFLKGQQTTQDHLPITSKTTAEWLRARHPLPLPGDKAAGVSFLMDGGLSFLPLTHNHMWFDDAGACSSLDFALRFLTPSIDLTKWHIKERQTIAAGAGRTYSEGRLWDADGTMVATMTQQSILRPKRAAKASPSL